MTPWLEWLLGLHRLRLDRDAPLSLRLATPPEAWIQLLGLVAAIGLVIWVYRRQSVSAGWRRTLVALRLGVILLLMAVVARPQLVLRRERVDPSVVAVLVDRSASMTLPNTNLPTGKSGPTRWQRCREILAEPKFLKPLRAVHEVRPWAFADLVAPLATLPEKEPAAALARTWSVLTPDGARSDLPGALAALLEQTRGQRLAGIVVASDGRQTESTALEPLLAQLRERRVAVHVVAAGSPNPLRNVRVETLVCDTRTTLRDLTAVVAEVSATGLTANDAPTLELTDVTTGERIETRPFKAARDGESTRIEFQFRPTRAGRHVLRVVAPALPDEQTTDDNAAEVVIDVVDEKTSVLYVEGPPRFEYRYLKNLMVREPSLESSCLLADADEGFAQEGTRPIRRFPQSIEELRAYDVVVLGDIDPSDGTLSPAQATMLASFVADLGGGAAFIAGERHMPQHWRNSPLSEMLPIRIDATFAGRAETAIAQPFAPRLTAEGRESALLRVEIDSEKNAKALAAMPGWYWHARVEGSKPGATVLVEHPTDRAGDEAMPLLVLGRYGAGRTLYLGSDDAWRWRRYIGDEYYENLWLQIIRTLARGRHGERNDPWRLATDRRRYESGHAVRITLTTRDSTAVVAGTTAVAEVTDSTGAPTARVTLAGRGGRTLEGSYTPRKPGMQTVTVAPPDGGSTAKPKSTTVVVESVDAEHRVPRADHALLRALAEQSGGRFLTTDDDVTVLAGAIPDRSVRIPDDVEESLWDSPLTLGAFAALLFAEWIIRRSRNLA